MDSTQFFFVFYRIYRIFFRPSSQITKEKYLQINKLKLLTTGLDKNAKTDIKNKIKNC